MTERNPTPASATLVAIDISKHRHEVLIEAPGHHRRRRLTILSTRADHDRLVETLTAYGGQIVIGFEATGDYHRGLACRLLSAGFELRLISSVALARRPWKRDLMRLVRGRPFRREGCFSACRSHLKGMHRAILRRLWPDAMVPGRLHP